MSGRSAEPRAIVVGSDAANRTLLCKLLESDAFVVSTFDDAHDVLSADAPPDLIVTELALSRLDGWRLCRLLRSPEFAAFNRVPILVVSNSIEGAEAERVAGNVGANGFLARPFDETRFLHAVRRIVAGKSPHDRMRSLVVEADAMQAEQCAAMFRELGWDADFVTTAQQALDRAAESAFEAFVVTEARPEIDGKELLAGLRTRQPDSAYVILSQAPSPGIALGWMQAGACAYVRKPVDAVALVELCNQVVVEQSLARREGRQVLAMARDTTDRERAEEDREKLEEQLRHAQKMEAVGRLAGGLAHDFNNMLCAILGNTELALSGLPEDSPVRKSLQPVTKASKRASELTRKLLAFSRKHASEPKIVNLAELIESLHPMLARLLGEDILLKAETSVVAGNVRVDPGEVEQVVLNLAVNARDAMPGGGSLLFETHRVTLDEDYCALHAIAEPGDYILLAVSDTGIGMDAETRTKIFEPFFTTKDRGKGTGLGLATAYGTMERAGGRIEVYSEPGQGTTFKLYFPCVSEVAAPLPAPIRSEPPRGKETVLVVEDEDIVRDVALRVLARSGYRVLTASSAHEAIELVERHSGPIDLLLTDVVMPKMNGLELATELSERYPALKVLFTSGYTEGAVGQHGLLDEGAAFLPKPYTLATLTARVREVLDDKRSK